MLTNKELSQSYKVRKEGDDLIVVVFLGTMESKEDSKRQAEMVREEIYSILNENPSKVYKVLVDASLSSFRYMSSEAKEIYSELAKLRQLQKAAVVGQNTFLEVIVNLIMLRSGKDWNFHWFTTLERAKRWLEE